MAKARVTINPIYKGGAGGYTFYERGGEQVMRQRKNNSNYGESASRTLAQMYRRIRWGNLVNTFKAMKSWQSKAYDSKLATQTDYNIFVSLNVNSATVGSTKAMNQSGAAIWEAYQVSRGSVPPVANSVDTAASQYVTDIKLTITLGASTTVGALSADIVANNPQFAAGDNVAFSLFRNWQSSGSKFPYAASQYSEITLDTASTQLVSAVPVIGSRIVKSAGGFLALSFTSTPASDTAHEVGFVCIHTRRTASVLTVSSQNIVMSDESFVSQYSGAEWDLFCIETYGITEEAPLEPSFKKATIESITANGSPIVDGAVLIDQQVIRVTGQNLYAPNFRFVVDGVEYTPLAVGDGYVEFILTAAGSFNVYLNGSLYLQFRVDGIYPPSELTGLIVGKRSVDGSASGGSTDSTSTNGYCLNFAGWVSEEYPAFRLGVYYRDADDRNIDDYTFVNCSVVDPATPSENAILGFGVAISDVSKPCYVSYKGFIVFVGNY